MADDSQTTATDREKKIAEAANRALAEARARKGVEPAVKDRPKELNGREGPDPVRYGDWENKGILSDF